MRISKLGSVAVVGAALAVPAAGLAAGAIAPANGRFVGRTAKYVAHGKTRTGKVTLTVAKHRITGVTLLTADPPFDAKRSHGMSCDVANEFLTKGHKASGTLARNGKFHYKFKSTSYYHHVKQGTEIITVTGAFTNAKHVKGTFRDEVTFTAASPGGKGYCDTGTVHFSGSHGR